MPQKCPPDRVTWPNLVAQVLEVKLLEESYLGVDSTLGRAEVSLSRLKGNKAKAAEWHKLTKGGKQVGEVCVELLLNTTDSKAAAAANASTDSKAGGSSSGAAAEEPDDDIAFFALSGAWEGYVWHAPSGEASSAALQGLTMDLVFSSGAEVPMPHHAIAGTGTDRIGSWELQAGRSYTQTNKVPCRVYPTVVSLLLHARCSL